MIRYACKITCALIAIASLYGNAAAQEIDGEPEFIIGFESVCSAKDQNACVRLGSPWNAHALKKALPGYEIEFVNDCEGVCFAVKRADTTYLAIFGSNDKVAHIVSPTAAADFRGHAIGDRLNKATGANAICSVNESVECWREDAPQIKYVAEGCDLDTSNEADTSSVAVPDCAIIGGIGLSAERPAQSTMTQETSPYVPEFAQYPADKIFTGRTRMPDFSGRDRSFREYRTKIKEGLAAQGRSNFAGRYNAVHIGLTGGFVLAVVESATGRVIWSDVLGGGPYYEYDFKPNSRLLVMQWSNGEGCFLGRYEWTGAKMKDIGEPVSRPADHEGNCTNPLPNALYPFDRE